MKHFPGRTVIEILTLANDIMKSKGKNNTAYTYVDNCLLVGIDTFVDNFPTDLGYDFGTVKYCAEKIAIQLDSLGYVDISL